MIQLGWLKISPIVKNRIIMFSDDNIDYWKDECYFLKEDIKIYRNLIYEIVNGNIPHSGRCSCDKCILLRSIINNYEQN